MNLFEISKAILTKNYRKTPFQSSLFIKIDSFTIKLLIQTSAKTQIAGVSVYLANHQTMSRSFARLSMLLLYYIVCVSCNNNKPKPASEDVTKTAVTVNDHKDSVTNNPEKKYGNATVADPCVKCLIQVVQSTEEYKTAVIAKSAGNLNYIVNWVKGATPGDTTNKRNVTNALKLDVMEKGVVNNKIASFIYDNSLSKLYLAGNGKNTELKVDTIAIKKIRMKCFWGVASSK